MPTPAEFLQHVAQRLETDAAAVDVREASADVLELRVASNDVGRIIGRDGHNISALRVLVAAVGARTGHKVTLELIEP